jgi:hypothetical protein
VKVRLLYEELGVIEVSAPTGTWREKGLGKEREGVCSLLVTFW